MSNKKEEKQIHAISGIALQVSHDLNVQVLPSGEHAFLMTTHEVAKGYGVDPSTIRSHKVLRKHELIEGEHFLSRVENFNARENETNNLSPKGVENFHTLQKNVQPQQIYWTKSGVIRLGFFIKSERAKLFRDWAEAVVLQKLSAPQPIDLPQLAPRRHNRLNSQRLVSIMADVCCIKDQQLRERIASKLLYNA